MKRIFSVLFFIGCISGGKAQMLNSFFSIGDDSTRNGTNGVAAAKFGYQIFTSFADTSAANAFIGGRLKGIAGVRIRTGNKEWLRSENLQYWIEQASVSTSVTTWNLSGNAGTDPASNFIGTTDDNDVVFKRNNIKSGRIGSNTSFGISSLELNTSGADNTAIGNGSLSSNTSGVSNTSIGSATLSGNINGGGNTAIGNSTLFDVTTGSSNIGVGAAAGSNVISGSNNIFIGNSSSTSSSSVNNSVAIGHQAYVSQDNTMVLGSIAGINGASTSTKVVIGGTSSNSGYPFEVQGSSRIWDTLEVGTGFFLEGIPSSNAVSDSVLVRTSNNEVAYRAISTIASTPTLQQAIDAGKDVSYSMDSTYFWKFTNTGGDKSFVRLDNIDDGTIDLRFYNGGALSDSLTGFIDNTGASAFHYVSANHFIIRKGLGIFDVFPQTTVNANNITANRAAEMPDSNGIIPLRVKLGSTTYSPDVKGTIDLGTVGTVTNVSATDGSGFDFTVTNPTTTPTISLTTSLTTGSVPFIGASGALSQDNSNLFFDNTQKQLGIGTNIPSTFVSQTGITGGLLNVTNSVAYARMYAQGVTGGLFAVADLGAGTDVKQLQFRSDNGLATMEGVNDIGTALTYNFMTFDLSNGNVGVGGTPTEKLDVTGNIKLNTAGNKILIATGSNASIGTSAAMTAGTITISTTAVTANSKIFLTAASVGGTQGILSVGTITAGTSFVINSSSATDTGTVNWWIVN